jgi:hypothetical protein
MATSAAQKAVGTDQYNLAQILGIWALAAAPMALLTWVVFPALKDVVDVPHPTILLWILILIGVLWQVVLSLFILYREEGTLNLTRIRQRTWRQQPRDPKTGQPRGILWLWILPALVLAAVRAFALQAPLNKLWIRLLPFLAAPAGYDLQALFETPER